MDCYNLTRMPTSLCFSFTTHNTRGNDGTLLIRLLYRHVAIMCLMLTAITKENYCGLSRYLGDLDSGREVLVQCRRQTLTVAATFMLYWLSLKSGCTARVVLQCRSCRDVAAASSKKAPK